MTLHSWSSCLYLSGAGIIVCTSMPCVYSARDKIQCPMCARQHSTNRTTPQPEESEIWSHWRRQLYVEVVNTCKWRLWWRWHFDAHSHHAWKTTLLATDRSQSRSLSCMSHTNLQWPYDRHLPHHIILKKRWTGLSNVKSPSQVTPLSSGRARAQIPNLEITMSCAVNPGN